MLPSIFYSAAALLIRRLRQSDPKAREVALASMRAVLAACQDTPENDAL